MRSEDLAGDGLAVRKQILKAQQGDRTGSGRRLLAAQNSEEAAEERVAAVLRGEEGHRAAATSKGRGQVHERRRGGRRLMQEARGCLAQDASHWFQRWPEVEVLVLAHCSRHGLHGGKADFPSGRPPGSFYGKEMVLVGGGVAARSLLREAGVLEAGKRHVQKHGQVEFHVVPEVGDHVGEHVEEPKLAGEGHRGDLRQANLLPRRSTRRERLCALSEPPTHARDLGLPSGGILRSCHLEEDGLQHHLSESGELGRLE